MIVVAYLLCIHWMLMDYLECEQIRNEDFVLVLGFAIVRYEKSSVERKCLQEVLLIKISQEEIRNTEVKHNKSMDLTMDRLVLGGDWYLFLNNGLIQLMTRNSIGSDDKTNLLHFTFNREKVQLLSWGIKPGSNKWGLALITSNETEANYGTYMEEILHI